MGDMKVQRNQTKSKEESHNVAVPPDRAEEEAKKACDEVKVMNPDSVTIDTTEGSKEYHCDKFED